MDYGFEPWEHTILLIQLIENTVVLFPKAGDFTTNASPWGAWHVWKVSAENRWRKEVKD